MPKMNDLEFRAVFVELFIQFLFFQTNLLLTSMGYHCKMIIQTREKVISKGTRFEKWCAYTINEWEVSL